MDLPLALGTEPNTNASAYASLVFVEVAMKLQCRITRFLRVAVLISAMSRCSIAEEFLIERHSAVGYYTIDNSRRAVSSQKARIPTPLPDPIPGGSGGTQTAPLKPLTVRGKFGFYLGSSFGPASVLFTAAGSAVNQARGAIPEWGQGMDGYGRRFASSFGHKAIRQFVRFAWEAAWDEDPRYHASERTGVFQRALHASGQTFVSHKDSGGIRFPYARFIGVAGGVFISRQWHPEGRRSAGEHIVAAASSIGLDMARNVFYEFWPDIKRRLRR